VKAKIVFWNLLLAILFLIYLCISDALFVFVVGEQVSSLNNLLFLIVAMPFIGAFLIFRMMNNTTPLELKVFVGAISSLALSAIGYIEVLWVAAEFHNSLGGSI